MFALKKSAVTCGARALSSSVAPAMKVAVLGAAGGIGQPLSLLLKLNPAIKHLSLFDIVNTPGVAADISHCDTPSKVTGHVGADQVGDALKGADIVVIPAGVPRKPGMTRDDLFNTNASIVANLAAACAKHCPKAHLLIIANPVNSTVPIVREVLKKAGVYDPKRLFGVTTLDVVRANNFVGEAAGKKLEITVVGGHAGTTILPLLSQSPTGLSADAIAKLTHRIQFGGDEVVQAKAGTGSATLSMAYAGNRFTGRLIDALQGKKDVVECTFVESTVVPGCEFFASKVELGKNGVAKIHGLGQLSATEEEGLKKMSADLAGQIKKGIEFAKALK